MLIKNTHVLSPHVTEGVYDIRVLDGKIAEVGESLSAEGESVRDAGGAYVTPGLIDAHTHLGLKADSLGEFYADHNEKKMILSPEMRAIDAINPLDRTFEEARNAGITCYYLLRQRPWFAECDWRSVCCHQDEGQDY